ncbi:MAG: hypothetical protein GX575_13435 [Candidatus Anammoximicrobium sp.]|nr:hypothetical protein [Candidatus Anammoximicrobium sp.]
MPIPVVCPGCQKRFNVSDKFAGKKGPCPHCKTIIQVPEKGEEVVIHAPEQFGPKDTKGRAILKPIARNETKVSPRLTAVILVTIVAVLAIAWMFRSPEGDVPLWLLALGAIGLAPPLAWAGYAFLRDDELEPYSGKELSLRVLACSAVYAILWGLVALITGYVLGGDQVEVIHMVFIAPVMIGIGTFGAHLALDLEPGTAAVHCSLYLLVTVTLRLIMGLTAF